VIIKQSLVNTKPPSRAAFFLHFILRNGRIMQSFKTNFHHHIHSQGQAAVSPTTCRSQQATNAAHLPSYLGSNQKQSDCCFFILANM
jgi:hypothetical protein